VVDAVDAEENVVQPTPPAQPEQRPFPRRAAVTGLAAGVIGALWRSTVASAQDDTTVPQRSTPDDTAESESEDTTTAPTETTGAAGGDTTTPATSTTAPPRDPTESDRELLAFANTVELAAAELYAIGLESGGLDEDTTAIAVGFADHHRQAAEAIAGLIGADAPNEPNDAVVRALRSSFDGDQDAIVEAAFELESAAAATHLELLGELRGTDGAALVASIQPIEARQAVVLGDSIGLPLAETVPEVESTDAALDPDEFPID
jgi:hypothetical protein